METPIATGSLVMGSLTARHARYRPRHTAVIIAAHGAEHEIRLTWREFDAYLNRCANTLLAHNAIIATGQSPEGRLSACLSSHVVRAHASRPQEHAHPCPENCGEVHCALSSVVRLDTQSLVEFDG